jgi:hypothetical protein
MVRMCGKCDAEYDDCTRDDSCPHAQFIRHFDNQNPPLDVLCPMCGSMGGQECIRASAKRGFGGGHWSHNAVRAHSGRIADSKEWARQRDAGLLVRGYAISARVLQSGSQLAKAPHHVITGLHQRAITERK